MLGQHGAHRFQVIHKRGHQRFHTFDRNGVGDGFEHVFGVGNRTDQGLGTGAHGIGQLQFAASGSPDGFEPLAIGALVGSVEFLDSVDFVTEEFDTHRVRRGRWEHVEDAATHGEFAAIHDQFHARVGVFDESLGCLVKRQILPYREYEWFDVAKVLDHRLNQRANRHDKDANRPEHRIGVTRVLQSAEHGHTAGHGVRARAQALVRQGFPRLELGDIVRVAVIPGAQRSHGFLGFAAGSHDQHHRLA